MIYCNKTNLNTEVKQVKILQAKQFLVPSIIELEYHIMGGGGGILGKK